ncbi:MAG: (Fe-S)-binding protein [Bacteroidales bacterium]|nr:(Fe-S)-binding protein [Bacteroidales bacterium]
MDFENITVNLFVPCCMDLYLPEGTRNVISLLEKMGDRCYYNTELTCCGRQFMMRGEREITTDLAYRMMMSFDNGRPIVVPSTACVAYVKKYFEEILSASAVRTALYHITHEIYELCDYIVNVKNRESLGNTFSHKVFFFSSCSARNIYQTTEEAEKLLRNTKGLELITDPDMKVCCTANSDLAMRNGELSEYMLKRIVDRIEETGAEYITSTDVHCLQYIDAYIQSQSQVNLDVIPIFEILNSTE